MAFTKITNEDRQGKGNVGQPDTPLLTTTEMQEQMDSLANLAIDAFNTHIDEISSENGAANIGCTVPTGFVASANLFSIIDAIALVAKQADNAKHTHPNKTLLDGISDTTLNAINNLVSIFAGITGVDSSVSSSAAKIPNSLAVTNFVVNYDIKTKVRDAIFPIGAVYTTTLLDPDSLFGTSGKWQLIKTEDGIKYYKRLS